MAKIPRPVWLLGWASLFTDAATEMIYPLLPVYLSRVLGAGAMSLSSWQPIAREHWPWVAQIAVTGSIGQWAITEAFKRGEASLLAPFEYTALAWGVALDLLLWGTIPSAVTFAGAAVVIASGTYLIHRERVVHRLPAVEASEGPAPTL